MCTAGLLHVGCKHVTIGSNAMQRWYVEVTRGPKGSAKLSLMR
jgi:hypothetical protein